MSESDPKKPENEAFHEVDQPETENFHDSSKQPAAELDPDMTLRSMIDLGIEPSKEDPDKAAQRQEEADHRAYLYKGLRSMTGLPDEVKSRLNRMQTTELEQAYDQYYLPYEQAVADNNRALLQEDAGEKPESLSMQELKDRSGIVGPESQSEPQGKKVPSPTELRGAMKELAQKVADGWEAVERGSKNLRDRHGVSFVSGRGSNQENEEAQGRLESLLGLIPRDHYEGKAFKPVFDWQMTEPMRVRPDGTVEYNPDTDPQQLHDFYMKEVMGLKPVGQETRTEADDRHHRQTARILDRVSQRGAPAYLTRDMIEELRYGGMSLDQVSQLATPEDGVQKLREIQAARERDMGHVEQLPVVPEAAAEAPITAPEPEPAPPEIDPVPAQETVPDEVSERELERLRDEFVRRKAEMDQFRSLSRLRLGLSKEAKNRVSAAYEEAEEKYGKARAEFIGASVERYLSEEEVVRAARIREYGFTDRKNWLEKVHQWGSVNMFDLIHKSQPALKTNAVEQAVLKRTNIRTVVNLTLIGAGTILGAGTGAGMGMAALRSASAGLAVGFGFRNMLESMRRKRAHREFTAETVSSMTSLAEVEEAMAHLEMRAGFDGKVGKEFASTPEFELLAGRQKELLEIIQGNPDAVQVLSDSFRERQKAYSGEYRKERTGRRRTAIAGVAAGAAGAVGLGRIINRVAGAGFDGADAAVPADVPEGVENPVEESPLDGAPAENLGAETPATTEIPEAPETPQVESGSAVADSVEIGASGVEGTLNGLRESNPAQYDKLMEWLHSQEPTSRAKDSSLIHRAVRRMAEENGYTIGKGGLDLNRIESGAITFHEDGSFSLDNDKISFMGEAPSGMASESLDLDRLVQDRPAAALESLPDAPPDAPFERELSRLSSHARTSESLRDLLGSTYSKFMNEVLMMDARELNKIQDNKLSYVIDLYNNPETPPSLRKSYGGLFDQVIAHIRKDTGRAHALSQETIRSFVTRLAWERVQK